MIEIAGGIILAVFGLIALFIVFCIGISIVTRPRQRLPSTVPWHRWVDYRKMARQDRMWFAVGLGMVVLCFVGAILLSK